MGTRHSDLIGIEVENFDTLVMSKLLRQVFGSFFTQLILLEGETLHCAFRVCKSNAKQICVVFIQITRRELQALQLSFS